MALLSMPCAFCSCCTSTPYCCCATLLCAAVCNLYARLLSVPTTYLGESPLFSCDVPLSYFCCHVPNKSCPVVVIHGRTRAENEVSHEPATRLLRTKYLTDENHPCVYVLLVSTIYTISRWQITRPYNTMIPTSATAVTGRCS